jgi:hypothetical protein
MTVPHFDPLCMTDSSTILYILKILVPPRLLSRWLPSIFTNEPYPHGSKSNAHKLPASNSNPNLDLFEREDIDVPNSITVTIKSASVLTETRCAHVQNGSSCKESCYFLDKGGKVTRWRCESGECEGNVYGGAFMRDMEERSCFGKKGENEKVTRGHFITELL